jgi:hypothetical protein
MDLALSILGWTTFGLLIIVGLALAVLGEIFETAASGYGASRFGGSRGSMFAALGDRPKKSEGRNETEAEKRKQTQETRS